MELETDRLQYKRGSEVIVSAIHMYRYGVASLQLTYWAEDWLHVRAVAQRTAATRLRRACHMFWRCKIPRGKLGRRHITGVRVRRLSRENSGRARAPTQKPLSLSS